MTGRTCGIIALLSAAGGAALVAVLREATPAPVHHETAPLDGGTPSPGPPGGVSAPLSIGPGTVAHVRLADRVRQDHLNDRLHFCVFDNGANDLIYVGTKYGMWSRREFDLSIEGKVVFAGKVEHLVYEGITINMGDVLSEQPQSNIGIHITRVTGVFK
jgi:hypothetical protein